MADFIDESIASRQAAAGGKGKKKEKTLIDFEQHVIFYEDSEGDLNVISEDEDLVDASRYATQKKKKKLKCSVIEKDFFEQVRRE